MKNCSYVLAAVMLVHSATFAQTRRPVPPASYEDTVLGWMNVYTNQIADYPKALPPDLLFTAVSFSVGSNHGENDKFYVSNVKISKE